MLKEELQKLQPSIADCLPHGAMAILRERTGKSRQAIYQMLRGRVGNDTNIAEMLKIVAEIATDEAGMQQQLAETVSRILNTDFILLPEKVQAI